MLLFYCRVHSTRAAECLFSGGLNISYYTLSVLYGCIFLRVVQYRQAKIQRISKNIQPVPHTQVSNKLFIIQLFQ